MIHLNSLFGNLLFLPVLLALFLPSSNSIQKDDEDTSIIKSEQLNYKVDTLITDLKIPWGLAFLPNGDMLFTERGGDLRLVQDGKLHPDPIQGVPEVRAKGQGGLLDITLHPDFDENGWIYLTYSKPYNGKKEGTTALVRARLKDHSLTDLKQLWEGSPAVKQGHHFGSRVVF